MLRIGRSRSRTDWQWNSAARSIARRRRWRERHQVRRPVMVCAFCLTGLSSDHRPVDNGIDRPDQRLRSRCTPVKPVVSCPSRELLYPRRLKKVSLVALKARRNGRAAFGGRSWPRPCSSRAGLAPAGPSLAPQGGAPYWTYDLAGPGTVWWPVVRDGRAHGRHGWLGFPECWGPRGGALAAGGGWIRVHGPEALAAGGDLVWVAADAAGVVRLGTVSWPGRGPGPRGLSVRGAWGEVV